MKRLVAVIPLLCACLDFEAQSIDFSYDAKCDRITLHLAYFGLRAEPDDLDKDGSVLDKAVAEGDFCLFGWPFHIQAGELRQAAARIDEEEKLAGEIVRLLADNLQVETIGFFLDARGRLSGGQIVRLNGASRLVALANRLVSERGVPEMLADEDFPGDVETRRLVQEAAAAGFAWFRLNGNSIEFSFPCSDEDLARGKLEILREALGKDGDEILEFVEALARSPFSVIRDGTLVTVRLGNASGRSTIVIPDKTRFEYNDKLVESVKAKHGLGFDARVAGMLLDSGAPLDPDRRKRLLETLDDAAVKELSTADADLDAVRAFEKSAAPTARPRLLEVIAALEARADARSFAEALPRTERVRILLADPGERATERLREDRKRHRPDAGPDDPREFFTKWLADEIRRDVEMRDARRTAQRGGNEDEPQVPEEKTVEVPIAPPGGG